MLFMIVILHLYPERILSHEFSLPDKNKVSREMMGAMASLERIWARHCLSA